MCLKDDTVGIAGMNHFVLPEAVSRDKIITSDSGRFGIHAMELLINEMIVRGASRKRLWAKVFGGGHVLRAIDTSRIPDANVEFSLLFLETEGIAVRAKDVGGNNGRKILFHTDTGMVQVVKIQQSQIQEVNMKEEWLKKRIRRSDDGSGFTVFDRRTPSLRNPV